MISKLLALIGAVAFKKAVIASTARILLPKIAIVLMTLYSPSDFLYVKPQPFTCAVQEDKGVLAAKAVEHFSDKIAKEFLLAPISKFESSNQAVVTNAAQAYGIPLSNAYTSINAGDTTAYPGSATSDKYGQGVSYSQPESSSGQLVQAENNQLGLTSGTGTKTSTTASSSENTTNTQPGQIAFWAPYYLPATDSGGTTGAGTATGGGIATYGGSVTDTAPPTGSVTINSNDIYTSSLAVMLSIQASDSGSGMGAGAQMQFSNDGISWMDPESYASSKSWTLSSADMTVDVTAREFVYAAPPFMIISPPPAGTFSAFIPSE